MSSEHPTAIVTGSTSGIGLGVARLLAERGYNLVINGFGDPDAIEETREELAKSSGRVVLYSNADMRQPSEIQSMVDLALEHFSRIDVLVNNAGIQHVAPVDEFPDDKWQAIIDINMSSAFHTIKRVLPIMKQQNWGRIINIASAHALVASPYKAAYVAAKHGVAGLTKTVALEVAEQGITCNAVCPGYVWTPLVEGQVADTAKARGISEEEVKTNVLLAAQPTKKFVTIEQVAEFVYFLCGEHAANITGASMPIDGGWVAK